MAKRKAADDERPSNKKAKLTANNPKAPKKTKGTRKGKGKKNAEVEEPPKPRVKRINKALKAKVKQVLEFVDSTSREESRLRRSASNENHVIVTEASLLASLMAMHADWELTDPRMASLLEASEAIVEQCEENWATSDEVVRMVVPDQEQETAFVEGIQLKVEGWDVEGINLLEVELELTQKKAEDEAAFRLFSVAEEADQDTERGGSSVVSGEGMEKTVELTEEVVHEDRVNEADTSTITLEKEQGREGVCPAPIKEL